MWDSINSGVLCTQDIPLSWNHKVISSSSLLFFLFLVLFDDNFDVRLTFLSDGLRKLQTSISGDTRLIGSIVTRAVVATSFVDSQPTSSTTMYVAMDKNTSSIFNFGEETFLWKDSQWILQTSWFANMSASSHAGLLLPGLFFFLYLSID